MLTYFLLTTTSVTIAGKHFLRAFSCAFCWSMWHLQRWQQPISHFSPAPLSNPFVHLPGNLAPSSCSQSLHGMFQANCIVSSVWLSLLFLAWRIPRAKFAGVILVCPAVSLERFMPLISSFPHGTSCTTITFLPSQSSAVLHLSKKLLLKSWQLYNEAFSLHSLWTMAAVTKTEGGWGRANQKGFHKSLDSLHVLLTLTGYVEVLVIPAGARRIKVVEEKPAHSYLGNRCYRLTQEFSRTPAPQFGKKLVCF